jgi:putative intracellular protease/amidase
LTASGEQVLRNDKRRDTGFFLNEFYEPYRVLVDSGYEVAIATPGGRKPVVDPESIKEGYWKAHPEWLEAARATVANHPGFSRPLSLQQAHDKLGTFQAVVVPGGQGVMNDLIDDATLVDIVVEMGRTDRPVGLICHAPALLTNVADDDNPFAGRLVTSVSGLEEFYIETFIMGGKARRRGIGRALEQKGFDHRAAFPGNPGAQRDCNLVTSQNPYSGDAFNEQFLAALEDYRRGATCVPVDG